MDLKTSFLNGYLKENVFMSQAEGFVVKGQEHKIYKLLKSLYVLKTMTASLVWEIDWASFETQFQTLWYWWCNFFFKKGGKVIVYLVVYVDGLLMI